MLAAALWLRPSPPARPAEAALAGVRPIVGASPPRPVAPAPRDDLSPQPAPVERRADLVRATSLEPAGTNPFPSLSVVEPLAAPPLIEIAPLPETRVDVEPIAIDPLTFTPMSIAPLVPGR